MNDTGLYRILPFIIAGILVFAFIRCSTAKKNVREVRCGDGAALFLTVEKEFVELGFRDVYNLAYKSSTDRKPRTVTGNISVLPEARRYKDRIIIRDFSPGKAKSLFNYHYLFPSQFTETEFHSICACYENNITNFTELREKIGALVYGDYHFFNEVFRLPDGYYLMTEHNGDLTITTDPSREARTLLPEKRHFNNIGYFDEQNRLHFRRGRIISDTFKDFYGKPVKQVEFITEDGKVDYTGEVEILWCDILYREDKTGINSGYILSAVNDKGEKLGEVFSYTDK